jgi:hypothetical protein
MPISTRRWLTVLGWLAGVVLPIAVLVTAFVFYVTLD